jgi:CrcB protein
VPLEITHHRLYRCRPRATALVAGLDAQQLLPAHSTRYSRRQSELAPEWRLFIITGFCGGLTTFSTFSSEIVALLQQGQALDACGAAALHLAGSVLMTFAGIATVAWNRG